MESWIICGIIASLCWGVYIVFLKIATSSRYHNLHPTRVFGAMSLGILAVASISFFVMRPNTLTPSLSGVGIAVASGLVWAIGMAFVIYALSNPKISIAKLAPLYNTNTLVAVILGILFLKEAPHHIPAVIGGAIAIVLGGILVTRQNSAAEDVQSGGNKGTAVPNPKRQTLRISSWILYGVIASLAWGTYVLLLKLAIDYHGCDPFTAFLAVSLGALIVSASMFIAHRKKSSALSKSGIGIAFASGVVWAGGIFAVTYALSNLQADVARLVPLYNTNTLVVALLGILLLHEVPKQRLITVLGAVLIVIGGSVVSIF